MFLTLNKILKSPLSSMMGIVKHKDCWVLAISVQLVSTKLIRDTLLE